MSKLYPQVAEAALGTEVRDIVVTNVKEHFPLPLRLLFTLARERKEGHRVDISARSWPPARGGGARGDARGAAARGLAPGSVAAPGANDQGAAPMPNVWVSHTLR